MKQPKSQYQRVLLKLSGEALIGEKRYGFSKEACEHISKSISDIHNKGTQIGIVLGGGNIFRGTQAEEFGLERVPADHIGMIATTINGLVLSQTLEKFGCKTRVMSALPLDSIIEPYHWKKALKALENGEVVIFVGGTGHPFFTTDTAAALRAVEIRASALLKATKVDGVYDKDPKKYADAKRYGKLSFNEALEKDLKVMDAASIALCRDNALDIVVFDLFKEGALSSAISCKEGTLITGE